MNDKYKKLVMAAGIGLSSSSIMAMTEDAQKSYSTESIEILKGSCSFWEDCDTKNTGCGNTVNGSC